MNNDRLITILAAISGTCLLASGILRADWLIALGGASFLGMAAVRIADSRRSQ